jgi:hypothetical protein
MHGSGFDCCACVDLAWLEKGVFLEAKKWRTLDVKGLRACFLLPGISWCCIFRCEE